MQQKSGTILYLDIDDVKLESRKNKFPSGISLDDFDVDPCIIRNAVVIIFRYVMLNKRRNKILKTRC